MTEPFVTRSGSLTLVRVTSGRYRIESSDGRRWRGDDYRPGSIGVTAPGNQNILRWRASAPVVMRSQHLHLDPTLAPAGVAFPDALTVNDSYVTASAQALGAALDEEAPAIYADALAVALVAHLVYRVASIARPESPPRTAGLSTGETELVVSFMRTHLGDDIDLDQLAALVGLSKFHFLRMFQTSTGETPARYLTRLRMQQGAQLLRTTADPVGAVATSCGYRSPGRFAAAFRREYGCTPRTYRRHASAI